MANTTIKRTWNQNRMVNIEDLSGMAFQSEIGGHTFEVSGVNDSGAAVSLSGTVTAVFLRADNAAIQISGAVSSGKAVVTLSSDCYTVPGRFLLTIFVTSNSQKVAVYACVGSVTCTTGAAAGSIPPLVTDSIQTGDIDASGDVTVGGVLDVTNRRSVSTLSNQGWYRVLKTAYVAGTIIDLYIGRPYGADAAETHKISIHFVSGGKTAFIGEASDTSVLCVDKIRCNYDVGFFYVDIHYNTSSSNEVLVYFNVYGKGQANETTVSYSLAGVGPSPSGETMLTEYTFAANTDGTITTPSVGVSGSQIIDSNCRRSGKVVSYHLSISSLTSSEIAVTHGAVLASGLVPPDYMVITLGQYWLDTSKPNLRCRVTTAGNLEVFWDSGAIPKSGQSVIFEITYIAA